MMPIGRTLRRLRGLSNAVGTSSGVARLPRLVRRTVGLELLLVASSWVSLLLSCHLLLHTVVELHHGLLGPVRARVVHAT